MRRSALYALLLVAGAGWAIAGLLAWALVARVGGLGVFILGVATLLVAVRAELNADAPAWSAHLMRRQYEEAFEAKGEARLARWAERVERHRLLYIARTVGIALALLGLNIFIRHQL
jgi:hypothetical protein